MKTPRALCAVSAATLLNRLYDKEARCTNSIRYYYRLNAMILLLQAFTCTGIFRNWEVTA